MLLRAFILLLLVQWSSAAETPRKPRIITSIAPVYALAINVAGTAATVENLLPASAEPHEYQLSPDDLRKLESADLLLINGLGIEDWLGKTLSKQRTRGRVVEITAGLQAQLIKGSAHVHAHGEQHTTAHHHEATYNPHVWLDPVLACQMTTNIMVALQRLDPTNTALYARNASIYVERLQRLHNELDLGLRSIRSNAFVTYHDAFPYFVRRYQLQTVGVVREQPEIEPSGRHLSELRKAASKRGAKILFVEPHAMTSRVKRTARDLRLSVVELDPLEVIPLSPGAYEAAMRKNLRVLQEHLK